VTLVRLVQLLNALSPILVTLLGIIMLARLVQLLNAPIPMLVTLLGIVMLVRLVQPLNALIPMLVTPLGILTEVTELVPTPKIGGYPFPTFFTAYPPNTLGIVTAPVAVEAVIVAPPFSTR
jgi:hypothetical protein